MARRWVAVLACALAVALLGAPRTAEARKDHDYAYRFEQVWSAAVRMVRVDLGYPITDKDEDIGFLLFEYRDHGRGYPGSIELVRVRDGRRDKVKVIVQIPAMPSYIEQMLLDRLGRKLRDEVGEPPPPPERPDPPAREPQEPDGPDEDGEDDSASSGSAR